MLSLALLLSMGSTQDVIDHLCIVQTVNTFAKHIACRDAEGMAACLHLVHRAQDDVAPHPTRIIGYGKRWCRYLLAFQHCAQTIANKYKIEMKSTMPQMNEVLPWIQAIHETRVIRHTTVSNRPCRDYHFVWLGYPMSQRFVQINGRWFLASPPFLEARHWDETLNHQAVFAISALALVEMPRYFEQAIEMADQDKPRNEVLEYLKRHYMMRDELAPVTKTSLPTPPRK